MFDSRLRKFTMNDFLRSSKATDYNTKHSNDPVPIQPDDERRRRLIGLITLMDELNAAWNSYCKAHNGEDWANYDRFFITSGFRSDEENNAKDSVNGLVGGAAGGGHPNGVACDFVALNSNGVRNRDLIESVYRFIIRYMRKSGINWDQIIFEDDGKSTWVHLGYRTPSNGNGREQTLMYKNGKYLTYNI